MEVKKSPKADLNNKKLLFVEIGLVLSLLITIAAFEYRTQEKKDSFFEAEATSPMDSVSVPSAA